MNENLETQRQRSHYKFWIKDKVRFSDLDILGHCNHTAICGYFESARMEFLTSLGIEINPLTSSIAIVHLEIDFIGELSYRQELDIGARVNKIGTSSVTLENGVFLNNQCKAQGTVVGVLYDLQKRSPLPWPDAIKEQLQLYN